ncbi:type II toxin-antitoxin system HicB family antitoxin [Bartonella sp. cb54]|uniref:type II toxin-antitoxin system HicB family antitoxin n=3 Tax=unclassified Bartonella TaxID=2645622 RepID=UPI0039A49162
MEYTYYAQLEADPDGGFIITFPDVPEAITAGENRTEALENAAEALGLALRSYPMRGLSLPKPQQYDELVAVTVDAWNAFKLAVIEAFNEANITKTELANRLGKKETEARRILDPNYPTKLQTLEQALTVLGKQVVITIKNAA